MISLTKLVDKYQKIRSDREKRGAEFLQGKRRYMIFQTPNGNVWGDVRTPEMCFENNIKFIAESLDIESDHLPVMEPWFGTGVYANMYGCPYVWRDGEAPAVHYKYRTIDEIRDLVKPDWKDSEIAQLILDTIKYFKSRTGDALPIVWTDTQSASDTATLILDAAETFVGCIEDPELIMNFMKGINSLIIEFSQVQSEYIGDAIIKPGHIMLSNSGFSGISISDDNLAVASPKINADFNLILDEEIGRKMGGIAIHSCGQWMHTMPLVKEMVPSCVAIDCAVDRTVDPNPNEPEKVRDIMAGSGINVHVRLTGETEEMLQTVKRMLHPELKLIVHPSFVNYEAAKKNYEALESLLSGYYK